MAYPQASQIKISQPFGAILGKFSNKGVKRILDEEINKSKPKQFKPLPLAFLGRSCSSSLMRELSFILNIKLSPTWTSIAVHNWETKGIIRTPLGPDFVHRWFSMIRMHRFSGIGNSPQWLRPLDSVIWGENFHAHLLTDDTMVVHRRWTRIWIGKK